MLSFERAMERHELACRLHAEGRSWREVGAILGVTRQRAEQIAHRPPRMREPKPPKDSRYTGVLQDFTGRVFGRLTVARKSGTAPGGNAIWECHCECGEVRHVRADNLKSGSCKSCGCLGRGLLQHYYRRGKATAK